MSKSCGMFGYKIECKYQKSFPKNKLYDIKITLS